MKKGTNSQASPFNSKGQDKENRLIYKVLREAKQSLTRRKLSERTGLEIATLCRSLFNLIHHNRTIKISHYAPCEKTGKTVMHFGFNRKAKEVSYD